MTNYFYLIRILCLSSARAGDLQKKAEDSETNVFQNLAETLQYTKQALFS